MNEQETVKLKVSPGGIQLALHAVARFGRNCVTIEKGSLDVIVVGVSWQEILPAKEFFLEHGSYCKVSAA
jgi:hypothetical protein